MNEHKQKSSNELMEKYEKKCKTSFEYLSNEIVYELFEYLNGYEIVKAFSNVNNRFEQLINSSLILFKTHFYLFHLDKFFLTNNSISSNLKILSIYCSNDLNYLNSHRWEECIRNSYPCLEKFYWKYSHWMKSRKYYSIYHQLDAFSSSFWIQRKWSFKIMIEDDYFNYIISPYRKTWYNVLENTDNQYSSTTSLVFADSYQLRDPKIVYDVIGATFLATICHLNMPMKSIPFVLLIRIRNALPDLLTLRIHSIELDRNKIPSIIKELESLRRDSVQNSQLRSMYIQEFNNNGSIFCFLFRYCYPIHNFEVKHLIQMNGAEFLRELLKTIRFYKLDFHSLILHFPSIHDEIINQIDYIVHSENLLVKKTIKYQSYHINIRWK